MGADDAAGRRRPVVDAERQLRQPLQHRRPQLQGDPADRARGAADGSTSCPTSTSPGRAAGSIPLSARSRRMQTGLEPRTLNRFQQLNAIKISGLPTRSLEGRPRGARGRRRRRSCRRAIDARLHGRVAAAPSGVGQVPARDGAGDAGDLPGARRAVQLVPRSVRHPRRLGAARDVRRADLHLPEVRRPARVDASASRRAGRPRSTSTRRSAWSRWRG